jgi:hypothetical protein
LPHSDFTLTVDVDAWADIQDRDQART